MSRTFEHRGRYKNWVSGCTSSVYFSVPKSPSLAAESETQKASRELGVEKGILFPS